MDTKLYVEMTEDEKRNVIQIEEKIKKAQSHLRDYVQNVKKEHGLHDKELCILTYDRPVDAGRNSFGFVDYKLKEEVRLAFICWEEVSQNDGFKAMFYTVNEKGKIGNEICKRQLRDISYEILEGYSIEDAKKLLKTIKNNEINTKKSKTKYKEVDLALPSGRIWCDRNVGAKSNTEYGDYFMWGDPEPATNKNCDWEHYKLCNGSHSSLTKYNNNSSYGTVDNKTTLEEADDAVAQIMGGNWRMPDKTDFEELLNTSNCTNKWTTANGVYGILFTSVRNGKTLFFPAAGYRDNSSLYYVGSGGSVWSRSLYTDYPGSGWLLYFGSGNCSMSSNNRCGGFSVRGIKETRLPRNNANE